MSAYKSDRWKYRGLWMLYTSTKTTHRKRKEKKKGKNYVQFVYTNHFIVRLWTWQNARCIYQDTQKAYLVAKGPYILVNLIMNAIKHAIFNWLIWSKFEFERNLTNCLTVNSQIVEHTVNIAHAFALKDWKSHFWVPNYREVNQMHGIV